MPNTEYKRRFGEDFRELLQKYELTMGDASRLFGVSVVNISNVINGKDNEQPPKKEYPPLPACVSNDHCKARKRWGDGECGCWHDSIGILAQKRESK